MHRDINMKLCFKCCGGEIGETLGHVTCEYGTHTEHLKHLGLTIRESKSNKRHFLAHITCPKEDAWLDSRRLRFSPHMRDKNLT